MKSASADTLLTATVVPDVTGLDKRFDYIVPDRVHVLSQGRIVKSGDKSLALELEAKGYADIIRDAA